MELQVRAVSARNLIDKQTFGKQDPYCKLTIRKRSFKTRVHNNGGTQRLPSSPLSPLKHGCTCV